uniref:protein artichoke-like n=1 Tax=Styela clava TaxID=7725 RepID=UPI00193A8404|nr:protein artichoke-like [Styela clava]
MKLIYLSLLVSWWESSSSNALEVIELHNIGSSRNVPYSEDGERCLGACTCYGSDNTIDCKDTKYDVVPSSIPYETRELDLSYNEITTIRTSDFKGLENMENLDMNHNSISNIQRESFSDMTSLTTLKMNYNSLRVMRMNMFYGLTNLKTLEFQYNTVNLISASAFSPLSSLDSLRLDFNILFSPVANESFAGLTNLTSLSLAGNMLYQIPMDALQIVKNSLQNLNVSYNTRITIIGGPNSPAIDLPNLQTLDMSFCRIQSIVGGSLAGLPNLKSMDLSANSLLTLFPRSFVGNPKLSSLYLLYNPIQTFPHAAFSPISKSLEHLHMSYYALEIGNLTSLYDETYLANLTTLSLKNGNLVSISGDSFFKNLKKLEHLSISYNQLTDLPTEALSHLTSLKTMTIVGNKISRIGKGAIPSLLNLQEVELSYSDVIDIDENSFHDLNLIILRLNDNKITNISENAFNKQTNLAVLDISNNLLTTPNSQWFQGKPLTEVKLDNNPWNCDCESEQYWEWTESQDYSNIESIDDVECNQPRKQKGDTITNLQEGEITCDFGECPSTCICIDFTTTKYTALTPTPRLTMLYDLTQKEYSKIKVTDSTENSAHPLDIIDDMAKSEWKLSASRAASTMTDCTLSDMTEFPVVPNSTEHLNLAYNKLTNLKQQDFINLPKLRIFIASDNEISSIENNNFANLDLLEQIHLNRNSLGGTIGSTWFSFLKRLTELRLDDNHIVDISNESFVDLESLQILEMSKNAMTSLQQPMFDGLAQLVYLNLGANRINAVNEDSFVNLTNLAYLYLNDNYLTTIPPNLLETNTKLIYLDLGGNSFSVIHKQFLFSNSIEILKMEKGYNTDLENGSFVGLPNLRVLRLAGSYISNIANLAFSPDMIDEFQSYNKSKLLTLDLGYNLLKDIPVDSFAELESLQTLGLNDNLFSEIPVRNDNIEPFLPNMETLYLSHTPVSQIPENSFISHLSNLMGLIMNDCNFENIPIEALKSNSKLGYLVLDRNPIIQISEKFSQLKNLVQLQLSDTQSLSTVSEIAFKNLTKLETLKLSGGKITNLGSLTFADLVNLEVIDLSNNNLTQPDSQWFSSINPNEVKSINLQDNPWVCDCGALEYKQWMEDGSQNLDDYFVSITCTEPQMYKSWEISEIHSSDLVCVSSSTAPLTTTELPEYCDQECTFDENAHITNCSSQNLRSLPRSCIPDSTEILILSNNRLSTILSDDFVGLLSLKQIMLDHNLLSEIEDGAFFNLPVVTHLDLSFNRLTKVPTTALADLSNSLLHLWLDDQRIPQVIENAFPLSYLKQLSLRNLQGLSALPLIIDDFSFAKTANLRTLDLSQNMIVTLSINSLTGLVNLDLLDMTATRLQEFPEEALRRSPQLTTLILNENPIESFIKPVTPILPKLKHFHMRNSELANIDDNSFLSDLYNLVELDLGFSLLSVVPRHSLQNKPSLTTLNLEHSYIRKLTQSDFADSSLNNISIIDFSGSKMSEIGSRAFSVLTSLSWLDLSKNEITAVADDAFADTNLQYLDLSYNNLTYVSCSWVYLMPQGQSVTLNLGGNPYDCSCGMVGYRDYMTSPQYDFISEVDQPVCATPQEFSGMSVREIQLEDLENYCKNDLNAEDPQYCSPPTTTASLSSTNSNPVSTTSSARSNINSPKALSFVLVSILLSLYE